MAGWVDPGHRFGADEFHLLLPGGPPAAAFAQTGQGPGSGREIVSLLETHGKGGAKPVLVFQADGSFWLGVIGPAGRNPHRHHAIAHLHRCLSLEG